MKLVGVYNKSTLQFKAWFYTAEDAADYITGPLGDSLFDTWGFDEYPAKVDLIG